MDGYVIEYIGDSESAPDNITIQPTFADDEGNFDCKVYDEIRDPLEDTLEVREVPECEWKAEGACGEYFEIHSKECGKILERPFTTHSYSGIYVDGSVSFYTIACPDEIDCVWEPEWIYPLTWLPKEKPDCLSYGHDLAKPDKHKDSLSVWNSICALGDDCVRGSDSFTVVSKMCGDIIKRDLPLYRYSGNDDGSVTLIK